MKNQNTHISILILITLAFLLTFSLSGCGSLLSAGRKGIGCCPDPEAIYRPELFYDGVLFDLGLLFQPFSGAKDSDWKSEILLAVIGIIDLPFSLSYDTLTLPYTTYTHIRYHCYLENKQQRQEQQKLNKEKIQKKIDERRAKEDKAKIPELLNSLENGSPPQKHKALLEVNYFAKKYPEYFIPVLKKLQKDRRKSISKAANDLLKEISKNSKMPARK